MGWVPYSMEVFGLPSIVSAPQKLLNQSATIDSPKKFENWGICRSAPAGRAVGCTLCTTRYLRTVTQRLLRLTAVR